MFANWLRSLRPKLGLTVSTSARGRNFRSRRSYRLQLESLEDRVVPATFVPQTSSVIATPGNQPFSVAVGDLNGDGNQDLVIGNGATPGSLIIETGNGNGTFQNAGSISIGSSIGFIRDVRVVNLDGGAFPDLVATAFSGNDVVILRNTTTEVGAAPTFAIAATIPVGSQPFWITTGDFSGDGNQDIVTANFAGNSFTVIPNTSTGPGNLSFGTPTTISIPGGGLRAVETIEINGKLDLVTADMSNSTLSIFQNTSTGPGNINFTLASTISLPAGSEPNALAIDDFNNDGLPDIAVGSFDTGNIYLLLNQGDGSFSTPTTIPNPGVSNTVDLIAGDFNGDGNTDLAVVGSTTNNASVLLGNGAGAFPAAETYPMGVMPWKVASGDFNGDGAPDLVVADLTDDTAIVLLNQTAANVLQVAPSTQTPDAGADFTVTVSAQTDGYTYQNYNGTVTLTDSNGLTLGAHTFVPADDGSYTFTVSLPTAAADTITASDGNLTGAAQVNVVAPGAVVESLPADTIDVAYNQTITADGGTGPYTQTVSNIQNAIPGLILPDGGADSLTIGGIPTATGTEVFTVTTTDSLNNTTVASYSIAVNPGITLSPANLPPGDVNLTYDSIISASGGTGAVTLAITNVVNPIPGLSLPTSGSSLDITGIPTAAGAETFTVTATDALGATATANYAISVNPAVSLSPSAATLPADTVGISYSQTITASGGAGAVIHMAVSSAIPGLSVVNNGTSISISGIPTATGTEYISAYAYDFLDSKTNPNFSYTITVNAGLTLSALPTPAVTTNVAYSQTITASGGTGIRTLTVANIVHPIPGLIIPSSGATSLAIGGTPTAAGTETFTVTVTDAVGASTSAIYSITVRNPVPMLSNVSIDAAADLGTPTTLTGTITGPANEPFTLDVNWGDGAAAQIYNLPAGATTFSESYTYSSIGSYTVQANVGDSDYSNDLLYGSTGGASPNPGQLYVFDLANGSETVVGSLPGDNVTEIAANPATGQAWLQYGANDYEGQQFNINTGSGVGSVINNVTHDNFNAMTFIGNTLYAAGTPATGGTSPSSLFTLDPTTGTATLIGATGYNGPVSGIAYDQATGVLYGIEGGSGSTFNLVSLNLSTGAATNLFPTGFAAGSLGFAPDGQLYAGASTGQLYLVNLTSQTVTPASVPALPGGSAISGLTMGNDTSNVQTSVNSAISLSAATLPADPINAAYNQTISATGGTGALSLAVAVTNAVPGLSIPANGIGSIAITGTPTAAGAETFSVTATDSVGGTTTTDYSITVNPAVTLSPNSLPADGLNVGYDQVITANGGAGTLALTVAGIQNPIPGLSVPSSGVDSIAIAGTPTVAGTETFFVTATDADGGTTGPIPFSITVTPAGQLTLSSVTLTPGAVGSSYGPVAFSTTGGFGAYTFKLATGNKLPAGLALSAAGVLNGTPTTAGTFAFSIVASDDTNSSLTGQLKYSMLVTPALAVSPAVLPVATVNDLFTTQLKPTGGAGSGYIFTAAGLPAGLTLSSSGLLYGTPTSAAGSPFHFTVTAADSNNVSRAFNYSLTVDPALALTIGTLPIATVGDKFSTQLTATGGSGTGYVFSTTVLPAWLTLSRLGLLSGTPPATADSLSNFTISVADNLKGTSSANYTLIVDPALVLSPTTLTVVTVGNPISTLLTAAGGSGAGYTYRGVGLPGWMTVSSNGLLSGTPTTAIGTPLRFTIVATDDQGGTIAHVYSLSVNPAPTITPVTLPAATVGNNFSTQLHATGGSRAGYFFTASGLPAWLSLSSNGLLSGTPTDTTGSPFDFTVTLTDSNNAVGSRNFTLTVDPAVAVTTSTVPVATVGDKFSTQLTAAGGSGKGYVFSGISLPTWLKVSTTGLLTGTPPASAGSSADVIVTVTDSLKGTSSANFTLSVDPALVLSPTTLTVVTVGNPFSTQLTAAGGSGAGYTFRGINAPGWMTVSASGLLAGTPTSAIGTPFHFTVVATDDEGGTIAQVYSLSVNPAPTITPITLPVATAGDFFSTQLHAAGGSRTGYSFMASGLPPWLTLSSNGLLSGTPTDTTGTPFNITVQLTDSNGAVGSHQFTLTIDPALALSPASLPVATVGDRFSAQFAATGGAEAGYAFKAIGLPAGLTLSSTGLLSGTPTTATGSSLLIGTPVTFTVTVTDSKGGATSQMYSLAINPALSIAPSALPAATARNSFSTQLTASGGSGAGYSFAAASLPAGLTLTSSGLLSGTPTTASTSPYHISVVVTDSAGGAGVRVFTLIVHPALAILPAALPAARVGQPFRAQLTASGGTGAGYLFAAINLPAWLSLSVSGLLTGTPPSTAGSPLTLTFSVVDSSGATFTFDYALTVLI